MSRKALGKGLSALIPDISQENGRIVYIECSKVLPNPYQPRKFSGKELVDLIESIKAAGIIQPIIVRRVAQGYQLVAGSRRLAAAKSLNFKKVPVIVKNVSDRELLSFALIENIQRENLNPLELAVAYKKLHDEFNMTHDEIGKIVGKSRAAISNTLRLLLLPDEIQKMIQSGELSEGHARALLAIKDKNKQIAFAKKIIKFALPVRETEKKTTQRLNSDYQVITEELEKILGTKVEISMGKKRGKITIEIYSDEDIERILSILKKK